MESGWVLLDCAAVSRTSTLLLTTTLWATASCSASPTAEELPVDIVVVVSHDDDDAAVAPDVVVPVPDVPIAEDQGPGDVPQGSCVRYDAFRDDPSMALFDPDCVLDVAVTMPVADWDALRSQSRSFLDVIAGDCLSGPPSDIFTWFEADVVVGGVAMERVGIRKKGFLGSLSLEKPSLKLRFDKFVAGRELADMERLTLNNMQQDPGFINTCLAYDFMAKAGVPTPRCNFARVRVNGVDLGIYAHVDSIKKRFLRRHFSSDEGNLYEATLSDFSPAFRGTWQKKTNEAEDDWSDIDAAVVALEAPDESLLEALEPIFDLDAFYTFWAAEVIVGHWDGYAGNTNNTYFYADPIDGRFRFIPWGADAVFAWQQQGLPKSVFAFGLLANRLYAHPEGRAAYLARLRELLEDVWDPAALVAESERMQALLSPHLPEWEREPFAAELAYKRSWVEAQRGAIEFELDSGPVEWAHGVRATVCWPELGWLSGSFATQFGTQPGDPLRTTATLKGEVLGLTGPFGNMSAGARPNHDPDFAGEVVVDIIGNMPDGSFVAVTFAGPSDRLVPGATVPIDWIGWRGVLGRVLPGVEDYGVLGLLQGELVLDAAAAFPGQPISGTFSATVFQEP